MASIKKLPNGTFQATISLGRDADGKQIRKYITRNSEKECKAAARKMEDEYYEGTLVNYKNIRLSAWMEEWLNLNKNRLSPSTHLEYKRYIDRHFSKTLGKYKLSQLNELHIQKYMNDKLETLSPTTVRKHIFVLRRILQDVLKNKNPAKDIAMPQKKEYIPHVVKKEEFETLLRTVKNIKYKTIIALSGYGGLRRGEIFALKWDDIDKRNNAIKIDESFTISENGYVDSRPKSNNSYRTVVLPDKVFKLLEEYRKQQTAISDRIFYGRPDGFTQNFRELVKKAGLSKIRFHDLRHYHANWLREKGFPDIYAAGRLGHDKYTLKTIYQHLDSGTHNKMDKKVIKLMQKAD
jgi:integrase